MQTRPGSAMFERGERSPSSSNYNALPAIFMVRKMRYKVGRAGAWPGRQRLQDDTPTAKAFVQPSWSRSRFGEGDDGRRLHRDQPTNQQGNTPGKWPRDRPAVVRRRSALAGRTPNQASGARCARSRLSSPRSGIRSLPLVCQVPRRRPGRTLHAVASPQRQERQGDAGPTLARRSTVAEWVKLSRTMATWRRRSSHYDNIHIGLDQFSRQ